MAPHLRRPWMRLVAAVRVAARRALPPPAGPGHPRAARARRAVERLLALALVGSLLAAWSERASCPVPTPPEPLRSLPVDVARDAPSRLRLLPGLGALRVKAILLDRERHGPVHALEDLLRVHGIGRKTVDGLRAAGAVVAPGAPSQVADAAPARGVPALQGTGKGDAGPAQERPPGEGAAR